MNPLLSRDDNRVLRALIESADFPQSKHIASIGMLAFVLRANLEKEIGNPPFQAWMKRNLKLLAAIELDASRIFRLAFPNASQAIIDRIVCADSRARTLLNHCRFGNPPRHSHVSEVIRGQRRTMRWVLHHHPFPALHLRREWVKQFEENWLATLTIIPCVCTYQEELSNRAKEEIYSSKCNRPERVTGIVLADLHGLNEAGVAKLCKQTYSNTVPLSHRPLSPS